MSIVLVGSTSGSITLQEPAVAGSTVLDLPAVSGTILTTTSPKAGNVIQVVQASTSTKVTITSSTYADTGLTVSITPSSTSSKILVLVCQGMYNSTNVPGNLRLVRGSTTLIQQGYAPWDGTPYMSWINFQYLDSPSTTSSTTYKVTFNNPQNSGNLHANYDDVGGDQTSYITVMEIAG